MGKIEWTGETWNPVVGCSIVSPGCTNCYAMKMAARIERMNPGLAHYRGLTQTSKAGPVWTGKMALAPEKTLLEPLRRKKPTTWFVNSMGDPFHEDAPDAWVDHVFAVMMLTPWHTYQVLTKRAARMREYVTRIAADPAELRALRALAGSIARDLGRPELAAGPPPAWPLPNVWLGVSAEDQRRADERIPDLLATPAAVRFVSAEPLLGPIDFSAVPPLVTTNTLPEVHWVIVGGESGPSARPMHPAWARSIRDECAASGTAFFFKQWGQWKPVDQMTEAESDALYRSNRIAKPDESQANLDDCYGRTCKVETATIRYDGKVFRDDTFGGFEVIDGHCGYLTFSVGKARAGRLLDSREWSEMPHVQK